jgi:hypothetical protein
VVSRFMAFGTTEVITTHVNVTSSVWPVQGLGKVRVLDRVSSTTAEVAAAASLPTCVSYILGYLEQVHVLLWHTAKPLLVGPGSIVTDETVDSGRVCEIERVVRKPVTCMTNRATSLVAAYVNSETVQSIVPLAKYGILPVHGGVRRSTLPEPVS